MGYIVKDGLSTELREEPLATSKSKETLFQGAPLGEPLRELDGFFRFELGSPNNDSLKGWILKNDCEELTDADRMPVNEAGFVQECVNDQLLFNATDEIKPGEPMQPALVSSDFLIARALFETGIKNLGKTIPGSNGVGPLQVTVAEWKDFMDNGGILATDARAGDRDHPVLQIKGAAFRQHVHSKAMSALRAGAANVTANDPFVPSFLDMFFAHVTNSPAAALAILDAQIAQIAPNTSIKSIIGNAMSAAELTALFQARAKLPGSNTVFFGTEASPNTFKAVVDLAEATLTKLLADAFDRIKRFRPDMLPVATGAGSAPWLVVAQKDEARGIKEGADDAEIKSFFADTDFGPVGPGAPPAWCGAFAAHCMKTSGNPTVAASVPKGAAGAAHWKSWGAELPAQSDVPQGAVVVLSPEAGFSHVGFFLGFTADKKNVNLLGGNTSNKVGEAPFHVSRIAAIRWLDLPDAGTAVDMNGITLPSSKVKEQNRPMAPLILKAFAAAGYGRNQQIAALANAIDESGLDPKLITPGENSVGLFQCRRFVGVGGNHSLAELQDPDFNTQLIIAEAKKVPAFGRATNLRDAVDEFVRNVERPKNPSIDSAKRFKTAMALIGQRATARQRRTM